MTEEWRTAYGYQYYEISDMGRIRSIFPHRGLRYLKMPPRCGYPHVNLHGKTRFVHHLVLETFVGPRQPGQEACHRNGNRLDARLSNLYWGTRTDNVLDAVRHGTHHNVKKTHAPCGHPYDTTMTRKTGKTYRYCRSCDNSRRRMLWLKQTGT